MNSATHPELHAILHGAAVATLQGPHARAFLRVSGSDAGRWLNGMVTNSVKDIAPGEGNYNFFLNAQGRIQGDAWIYREPADGPAAFLLATTPEQAATLKPLLDHFIIMDDVELVPALPGQPTLLVLGPEAPSLFARLGLSVPPPLHLHQSTTITTPVLICAGSGSRTPRFEITAPAETIAALRHALIENGAAELSAEALEAFRVYEGTPLYGTDIRNSETARDLPQETNQPHALHFNKGCYLGQEIVERIRSRGQVHRLFTAFELTGELPSALPVSLTANGKPAGEITSAAEVDGKVLALGYARREALDLKQPLTYTGGTASPRSPHPSN